MIFRFIFKIKFKKGYSFLSYLAILSSQKKTN